MVATADGRLREQFGSMAGDVRFRGDFGTCSSHLQRMSRRVDVE